MSGFEQKFTGAFKKAMGDSLRCSCGSSSTRRSEPEESLMHEDDETVPTEEEQEQEMEEGDDDPHLDLDGDQEVQAYNHIKDYEFVYAPTYDTNLLKKIGMDIEFTTIWKAIGWENIAPVDEQGSRILTIQFLCSLKEVDNGITFHLFEK
jgi:hypothetical protein